MIFKRMVSAITGAAMLVSYASVLAGCSMKEFFANESSSEKEETSPVSDGTITNGEWLEMVNDAFGMQVDENAEDGELDAARDWGVIGEDEEIDKNAPVDDKFVTSTLMRASGFADADSTDEEIINAAIEHGVISSPDAIISDPQQAVESLATAQNEWMTQEFEEHRNIELVEGVQNFSETMNVADFKVTSDGVTIPSEYARNLAQDSVFIVPKNSDGEGGAYKVVAKVDNGDGTVSVKSVPAAPEEIYDTIDVSGKFTPDMSTFKAAEDPKVTGSSDNPQGVSYTSGEFFASPLSNSMEDEVKIETMASVGVNSVDFNVDLGKGIKAGISVKDIALNADIDWDFGIFKGLELERIYMAVDYTTEISVESELFGSEDVLGKDYVEWPSIELGKVSAYICPGISINLRFDLTFDATGKISVSVSTGHTKGFEMQGSNFRTINNTTKSAEIALTGEAGTYVMLTLALSLDYLVDEIDLVSLQLKVGPTLKGEAKLHEEEGKDPLLCIDVSGSFKIELKLVFMEQVMKAFGVEASITLIDENPKFWEGIHLENFKKVPKCTLEDEEEEATTEQATIPVGILEIDKTYLSLDVGTSGKISVKSIPSGYSESDLVWKSSDPSKITVDSNGNVQAVSAGNASIVVSTKDGKNTVSCAVIAKANVALSENGKTVDSEELMAA